MRLTHDAKLKAARAAMAAEDAEAISVQVSECRWIAAMLWHNCMDRFRAAEDRAAIEAAWRKWKLAMPFMHLFATWGVLHSGCRSGACKRARRCAHGSMFCVRNGVLSSEEEAHARRRFDEFIRIMGAPETAEEKTRAPGARADASLSPQAEREPRFNARSAGGAGERPSASAASLRSARPAQPPPSSARRGSSR